MSRIASACVLCGLPTLGKRSPGVHALCQFRKQLESTHKAATRVATSKVLALLHMNLMVPMYVKIVGDKNYIFVCVDDYIPG